MRLSRFTDCRRLLNAAEFRSRLRRSWKIGWNESWIGYLSALNIVGAICMLLGGMGLLRRVGSLLMLQISIVIGAGALLLFQFPSIIVALLASALIGLSNGTSTPGAPRC